MLEGNRPMECIQLQKVMNSKLVAKHWLQNLAEISEYEFLNLQRPSIYCVKNQPQREAIVNSNLFRILSDESQRSSTSTITTIISK